MLSISPAPSMDRAPAILIVAIAARALAVAARRAGYRPLVADCFGDEDTRAAAHAHVCLASGPAHGLNEAEVLAALDELASGEQPEGVVCGTGFEDRPRLLTAISCCWKLIGNAPDTVARLKDPRRLAALCHDCAIAHPDISFELPDAPAHWLIKRMGGAGGVHVRPASDADTDTANRYFQRRIDGVPVSALVLADGRRAQTIGLSTQWPAPTARRPFRYGGAVRPAVLTQKIDEAVQAAAHRITIAAALVGLNSVDFLVDDDQVCLLEVNPRPGATLDIFEPGDGSLFGLHVAACNGMLQDVRNRLDGAAAAAIVYARRDIASVPAFAWPDWTADRQSAGTSVKADQPVCTVLASAATAVDARILVARRAERILADANAWVA
jgi:predicted ATP-grasp superfamily ATP-dependent carboligase